jgi:tetratricopeptide (TPR) repeat protein
MGEVYLAEDTLLPRCVAIKRVRSEFQADPGERNRILDEARMAARLSGGRIASVFDVLREDGDFLLVMEYVPGPTLRDRLGEPIDLDAFWDIALQCVQILESAHREGLVHRDIKPENIVISDKGQVRLLDFGIAGHMPGATLLTSEATEPMTAPGLVGTPAYMAPEALRGEEPDGRSDLYSLGVVFYEMLGGRRPFTGDTAAALVGRILETDPEPLLTLRPDLPHALAAIVHRLLARDPGARYPSAVALEEDLTQAHRGQLKVRTLPVPTRVPHRLRRRLRRAAVGLPVLAVVGSGILFTLDDSFRLAVRQAAGLNVLPDRRQVAVLPVRVDGSDPELGSLGRGLTEFLSDALQARARSDGFQLTSPRLVRSEAIASPVEALSHLGANLALVTRLTPRGNDVEVNGSLVETATGRTLRRARTRVPASETFGLARGAIVQSLRFLGEQIESDSLQAIFTTQAPGAFRAYLVGQGRMRAAESPEEMIAAVRTLKQAISVDPGYVPALLHLAEARLLLNGLAPSPDEVTAARDLAQRAVTADGTSADAHDILGRALWAAGDFEGAEAEYRTAVELGPDQEGPYYYLGTFLLSRRRYTDAAEVYRTAVDRVPECWQFTWRLGSLLFRMGRYDEARDAFRELTRRSPDNYRGYANLGGIQVLQGAYDDGLRALERANELRPGVVAWSNIGTARFNLRQFDKAIAAYQTALQFDYDDPEVWANLGDACWWAPGRRRSAADAYREAVIVARSQIESAPPAPAAHALLADVFPKLSEPDSARVHLARALAAAPNDVNVLYRAGLAHWQLGDTTTALDCLERAVAGGYPPVWIHDSAVFDAWRSLPRFQALVDPRARSPMHQEPITTQGE